MTRLDPDHYDDLATIVDARITSLSAMLTEWEARAATIDRYLTDSEKLMMKHRADRLRTEIDWHHQLSAALPKVIADESSRRNLP